MQFGGVTGFYRKFVRSYASIAAPLTSLLGKDAIFSWGNMQQQAFDNLKSYLFKPPILMFPKFTQPFYVVTDACGYGVGGALMQEINKMLHPIAFFSRKLKHTETRMSTTDREALAVIESLKHFKYLIMGHEIIVLTDHKPVLDIFNKPDLSVNRARMFLTIQDYHPKLKYISGKSNVIADALSRNIKCDSIVAGLEVSSLEEENREEKEKESKLLWDRNYIISEQNKDDVLSKIKIKLKNPNKKIRVKYYSTRNFYVENDLLVRKITISTRSLNNNVTQVVVPKTLIPSALSIFHDNILNAHCGANRMYEQARAEVYWKNMELDIKNYVKNCHECQKFRGHVQKPSKLLSFPIPERPWQRVHMDLLTSFNETRRGFKNILVIVDTLSRYVELIPLK